MGAAPSTLKVTDVWAKAAMGPCTGSYTAKLEAHATTVLLLSP